MDALCGQSRSMRRILMIINFFPPAGGGGVYRPLSFVKYLSRLSWEVTVVTPRPGEFWISDPGLEREIPSSVRVVRTSSLSGFRLLGKLGGARGGPRRSSGRFEALRRFGELFLIPDTYAGWVPFAARAAADLCRRERFDVLYSTSPPDSSHLVARRVARAFRVPWVADFRDPWINLYLRRPPTAMHRALHERLERSVSRADLVLVTTEAHERLFAGKYPSSKIERIPNGFDEEDFAPDPGTPPPDGPFTLTHCGMLTMGRSARPFLEGFAALKSRSPAVAADIRVSFIGARESESETWVARLGLEGSVFFENHLPHRECVARERRSHALLLIKHDDERYRGLVPGKLFEYIGSRRPILVVAPDGEASRIVRDLHRGETADIADSEGIAAALETLYARYRAGTLEESYSLDDVPQYSRRAEALRLDELLVRLMGGTCGEKTSGT
ncbi:MAG TPA: glycosyltransferase family 4 protein [Candidatus Bathyarchaeia archaeon]|nr:glycosyltransferase family 4 protein [Candidatus Bathyarchaeia archaeon]